MGQSPIDTLPSEVLLQVFHWLTAEEPIPVPWLFTEAPLTILHVCSSWRHLALHEAEFWRRMLITLNRNNPNFGFMFQLTLLYSKSKKLSIDLRGSKLPSWMEQFTNLAVPEFHRMSEFGARWDSSIALFGVPAAVRTFYGPHPLIEPSFKHLSRLSLIGLDIRIQGLFDLLTECASTLEELSFAPSFNPVIGSSLNQPARDDRLPLPRLMNLFLHVKHSFHPPSYLLYHISVPVLARLSIIASDSTNMSALEWDPGLENEICTLGQRLISLRLDLQIPSASMRSMFSFERGQKLRELIVPHATICIMFPQIIPQIAFPQITRLVMSASHELSTSLGFLENWASCVARRRDSLKDIFLVWDEDEESNFESIPDCYTRIERLREGGLQVKLSSWERVDYETDLKAMY